MTKSEFSSLTFLFCSESIIFAWFRVIILCISSLIENRVYNDIFACIILTVKLIRQRTNIKITVPKLLLLVIIIFTAASCNPTKYVPSGELLLNSNQLMLKDSTAAAAFYGEQERDKTLSQAAAKQEDFWGQVPPWAL